MLIPIKHKGQLSLMRVWLVLQVKKQWMMALARLLLAMLVVGRGMARCQPRVNQIIRNWPESGPDPAHQNRMSCGLDLDQFWFIWFALGWHHERNLKQEQTTQVPSLHMVCGPDLGLNNFAIWEGCHNFHISVKMSFQFRLSKSKSVLAIVSQIKTQ